jgi:hypothetical protein
MLKYSNNLPFFLLFLVLIACNSKKEKSFNIIDETKLLEDQRIMLLNKNLIGINSIIGDSIDLRSRCVFLYNSNDCETCVQKGFHLTNILDSIANMQVVFVITSSVNIGSNQLRYGYKNYVYYDEHDLIRNKLKYIYTPVFLFLDSSKKISNVFYPTYKMAIHDENVFINNFKELLELR